MYHLADFANTGKDRKKKILLRNLAIAGGVGATGLGLALALRGKKTGKLVGVNKEAGKAVTKAVETAVKKDVPKQEIQEVVKQVVGVPAKQAEEIVNKIVRQVNVKSGRVIRAGKSFNRRAYMRKQLVNSKALLANARKKSKINKAIARQLEAIRALPYLPNPTVVSQADKNRNLFRKIGVPNMENLDEVKVPKKIPKAKMEDILDSKSIEDVVVKRSLPTNTSSLKVAKAGSLIEEKPITPKEKILLQEDIIASVEESPYMLEKYRGTLTESQILNSKIPAKWKTGTKKTTARRGGVERKGGRFNTRNSSESRNTVINRSGLQKEIPEPTNLTSKRNRSIVFRLADSTKIQLGIKHLEYPKNITDSFIYSPELTKKQQAILKEVTSSLDTFFQGKLVFPKLNVNIVDSGKKFEGAITTRPLDGFTSGEPLTYIKPFPSNSVGIEQIKLSREFLKQGSDSQIKSTFLHEIAHEIDLLQGYSPKDGVFYWGSKTKGHWANALVNYVKSTKKVQGLSEKAKKQMRLENEAELFSSIMSQYLAEKTGMRSILTGLKLDSRNLFFHDKDKKEWDVVVQQIDKYLFR